MVGMNEEEFDKLAKEAHNSLVDTLALYERLGNKEHTNVVEQREFSEVRNSLIHLAHIAPRGASFID